MPYFVPAWALRTRGTSTMTLPSRTVRIACHQLIPPSISEEPSMYVGTQAARETHSAARSFSPHLRWAGVVGARSGLEKAGPEESAGAWAPGWAAGEGGASSAGMVALR